MRVVVDTNVFVSAALKDQSLPAIAVRQIAMGHVLLKSAATERQLFEVISRPYFIPLIAPETRDWLQTIVDAAESVTIIERIAGCRDPTDDKFLELAVNGHADLIVSGDADLLVLDPFRAVPIVTPASFLQGTFPPR
jgi:putative PIN family toxin of toxin-antitoxin system